MNSLDFNYSHMASTARLKHPIPLTRWPTEAEAAHGRLFAPISARPAAARDAHLGAGDGALARDRGRLRHRRGARLVRRFAAAARACSSSRRPASATCPSGPLLRIGTTASCPGCRELVDAVRRAQRRGTRAVHPDHRLPRDPPPARRRTSTLPALPEHHATRTGRGSTDWPSPTRPVRDGARSRCRRRDSCARCSTARELEALALGYRERVTDMHLPHIRELPTRAARAVRRRGGPSRARPASTASSCTTRTPTRWRRSCRR